MENTVSVIVPIYNVRDYLDKCISSIVGQTFKDLQIILVNDGSTDDSLVLCQLWCQKDNRIKVIDKGNGGLSDARNAGLNVATGTYVCFIDSDDVIKPEMIEVMKKAMDEHHAEVCVSDMEYLYEDGSTKFASGGDFTITNAIDNPHLVTINNSACNKLCKLSLFDDIEFPKGKYYEDLATIPSILYKASNVVKVNEPFYIYLQRKGSIAHSANKQIFDIYDAINDCIDYVKKHGNNQAVIEELKHFYIIHGLDLTTLRIKDFDDKGIRQEYLEENMSLLKQNYPNWQQDSCVKKASFKKKVIYKLLNLKKWNTVLKIYDK